MTGVQTCALPISCYATRLLIQARSYNIRDLLRELPVKTLDEFISNLENLINDYLNPHPKRKSEAEKTKDGLEDSNVEIVQRLLRKAKFLKVKGT